MTSRIRRDLGLFTIAAIIPLTGCALRQTNVDTGNRQQVLHISNQTEPQDLDPHIITGVPEMNVITALIEGLVAPDPRDLHPTPGAAESWDVSPDGMQYTFHLRRNGQWSNGDPVTAQDFAFSMQRILSPALAGEYAYMLYCVKNAREYHAGTLTDFAQVGVTTPDSFTLVVALQSPTPYFLSLIMHTSWFPVHRATVLKFGAIDQRGTRWTRAENFVGNGPFVLKTWETNRLIRVEKNPRYWDAQTTKLNAICFYPIESEQTEERAFRSGQIHVTHSVPINKIASYRSEHPELLHIDPFLTTYYYLINVNRAPFTDVRVRRALAMAVDRDAIVKSVTKAGEIPAHFFTPPNTAGYTSPATIPTDIPQAKKLLAEAGFPDGKGFPPIDILYNTSEAHQLIAQAIQEMWKQNLGITVTLTNQEWKVYLDAQTRKDYQVSRAGWTGDYLDPTTFMDMWVTGGGNNRAGWSSAAYDSLINAASRTADQTARYALFGQAETILMQESPIIPIYFYVSKRLMSPSVKGWYANLLDQHPYKYVYLEKD